MKIKVEKEIRRAYDKSLDAYLNADSNTYNFYLDKDFDFIGCTNSEEFLDKQKTANFFEFTGEHLSGITEFRNEVKIVEECNELLFIKPLFDNWFLSEDNWYYGRYCCSSNIKPTNDGYRFSYQHFSMPDSKSNDGQAIGFENEKVSIDIADNFPKIPVNIEDKIVQPFFTTKKGTEGTGLGLSITYAIVKAHSGGLRMQTKEGKGATFRINLQKTL